LYLKKKHVLRTLKKSTFRCIYLSCNFCFVKIRFL